MAKPKVRQKTKKISFVNQKGGVGKTTFSINVGAAAAELGARVCIREMDPQGNGSSSTVPLPGPYTMNDLLRPDETTGEVVEGSLASAIRKTGQAWPAGLYIVPAETALASREGDNGVKIPRERRLQIVSEGALEGFDLVIDDCPPSIGQLTVNSLTDSDEAHIVTAPVKWAVEGAREAFRSIRNVQRFHNPGLRFGGVWVNMFLVAGGSGRVESRTRLAELRELPEFQGHVNEPVINDIETIRGAAGASVPLTAFGRDTEAAVIFRGIAERFLND
ncbi:chromosome partitioning protein [Streptomyces sp. 846.5]|nr:ParA family protein [Streptomyces sp. 846.5]TDT93341.1 chromosome partitioning protein [Streptomyces sp. 846.5]